MKTIASRVMYFWIFGAYSDLATVPTTEKSLQKEQLLKPNLCFYRMVGFKQSICLYHLLYRFRFYGFYGFIVL